uniref:SFRICE_036430 n=1 Tax=Spodoptera frugiperda TaxID=7108 RepID=A0A2H1WNW3_SPOFR
MKRAGNRADVLPDAITFWGRGFDPFDPRLLSIKLDVVLSLNGGSCGVGSDVRVPQTMTVAGTRTYKEESTLGPRPKNLESVLLLNV